MKASAKDLIQSRYSCRSFEQQPLQASDRDRLADFLAGLVTGPLANRARFRLVAATESDRESLRGLGTYGFVKGAAGFIIGASPADESGLEDLGYLLERAVLEATDLGLGTCWLGGSFTKSSFARKIKATKDEIVPAVVAVGYPAQGSRENWVRQRAGGERRLPREQLFCAETFGRPLDTADAGPYAEALEAVRWAPSASNKQPWRLVRSADRWHLYLRRTKGYARRGPVSLLLKIADLQRVDMGIAMCHFELVTREQGLTGRWMVEQPPPMRGPAASEPPVEYTATWMPQDVEHVGPPAG